VLFSRLKSEDHATFQAVIYITISDLHFSLYFREPVLSEFILNTQLYNGLLC